MTGYIATWLILQAWSHVGLPNKDLLKEVATHVTTYHAYQSKSLLITQCSCNVKAVIYNATEQTIGKWCWIASSVK